MRSVGRPVDEMNRANPISAGQEIETTQTPSNEALAAANFRPAAWTLPRTPIGGDLQTIAAINDRLRLPAQRVDRIDVGDGDDADQIALHVNCPGGKSIGDRSTRHQFTRGELANRPARGNVLLLHGITGCHAAPYMKLLATGLLRRGYRTFRIDARGCGSMLHRAATITHAARSHDVAAAIRHIAGHFGGPIAAIGMSLGGNQLLRMLGRGDAPERLVAAAAVAPPVDLPACADNMDRRRNRIYNRYFIRALVRRMPPVAARNPIVRRVTAGPLPTTLRRFDDAITAPLAGYRNVDHYYDDASSVSLLARIAMPTLVIAARDDPIIPVAAFEPLPRITDDPSVDKFGGGGGACALITDHGGHAGYIGPRRTHWLADRLVDWTDARIGGLGSG